MRFIDEIVIGVASGSGGHGCASFRREAHVPRGGPDGGDGGRGGDLVVEATSRRNTLQDFRYNRMYRADDGKPGMGRLKNGLYGEALVLQVPVGTVIYDAETDDVIADLAREGDRFVLDGGRGGRGNNWFKSATNQTPQEFEEGEPGTELMVRLELKLVADVGLLGFPNAGKSTLLARISAARPQIAAYPFTTLTPQLGVVQLEPGVGFVVADLPGLIEGAAEGRGLGHDFLRHVERCALYLHLVSPEAWEDDPVDRFHVLEAELEAYRPDLLERPRLVVLTKADLAPANEIAALAARLSESTGERVHVISAVSGQGVDALIRAVWARLQQGDPLP